MSTTDAYTLATKSETIYIRIRLPGPAAFQPVQARRLTIPGCSLDLFVHRDENNRNWIVTEGRSGMILAGPFPAKRHAIARTLTLAHSEDVDLVTICAQRCRKYGTSPLYAPATPPACAAGVQS